MKRRPDGVQPAVADVLAQLWPPPSVIGSTRRSSRGLGYLALPNRHRPTYLLPARPVAVAAAAMMGFRPAHTVRERARARTLAALARCGAAALLPTVWIEERAESLVGHLAATLEQALVAGISLGPQRANRKPVLQLCNPQGTTIAFAKVAVNPLTRDRLNTEAAALATVSAADLTDVTIPGVLAHGTWRDLDYLVLSTVRTWSRTGIDPAARSRFLHDLVNSSEVTPAPLIDQPWWRSTLERLRRSPETEAMELLGLAERVEAASGRHPLTRGAMHGDFTPHNVCTEDGVVYVWDWERYAPAMPAGFDALHFAFHQGTDSDSRARLAALASTAGAVVEGNGAAAADGDRLFGAYLVHMGDRFLQDRQAAAGERRGAISTWLLPALATHLDGR